MSWRSLGGALALTAIMAMPAGAAGSMEKHLSQADVPKPVLDAVSAAYPGATMTRFSQEMENGQEQYEVAVKTSGGMATVSATADGKIVSRKETASAKDVPDAVAKAFAASAYAGDKVLRVEKMFEGAATEPSWEYVVSHSGQMTELVYSADGKLVKEEHKAGGHMGAGHGPHARGARKAATNS